MYHYFFESDDEEDTYGGIRLSYTFWGYQSGSPYGPGIKKPWSDLFYEGDRVLNESLKLQVVLGERYFFNNFLAINGEIAIGRPYFANLGLCFRFDK